MASTHLAPNFEHIFNFHFQICLFFSSRQRHSSLLSLSGRPWICLVLFAESLRSNLPKMKIPYINSISSLLFSHFNFDFRRRHGLLLLLSTSLNFAPLRRRTLCFITRSIIDYRSPLPIATSPDTGQRESSSFRPSSRRIRRSSTADSFSLFRFRISYCF